MAEAPGDIDRGDANSILRLPDDALLGVMRASQKQPTVRHLASTCRRLSELARTHMPTRLRVTDSARACTLLRLHLGIAGRSSFNACEALDVQARSMADGCWVPGVLAVAAQLSSLRKLSLDAIVHPTSTQEDNIILGPADGNAGVQASQPSTDAVLAGLICSMSGLQQLRELELNTNMIGPLAAAALGSLKQLGSLTSLTLLLRCSGGTAQLNLAPLSSVTGLLELEVVDRVNGCALSCIAPTPPTAAGSSLCLPSSLQVLRLTGSIISPWMRHLRGCPYLEELHIWNAETSATDVLEMVGRHTPGLQELSIESVKKGDPRGRPRTLPRDALGVLTALQHLVLFEDMEVDAAAHWEALGQLKALTCLLGLAVLTAPPEGWLHKGLRVLDTSVGHPQVAAKMLIALPALQRVTLYMVDRLSPLSGTTAVEAHDSQAASHLTAMDIKWRLRLPLAEVAPILRVAGNCLEQLRVDFLVSIGATRASPSSNLPDLGACRALTQLHLQSPDTLGDLWGHREAEIGDLVGCLQPVAPTLKVLVLNRWSRISPAAAKVLQQVLPRLEQVSFRGCRRLAEEDPSTPAEEQLQQLQQALRPGLNLDVSTSIYI